MQTEYIHPCKYILLSNIYTHQSVHDVHPRNGPQNRTSHLLAVAENAAKGKWYFQQDTIATTIFYRLRSEQNTSRTNRYDLTQF